MSNDEAFTRYWVSALALVRAHRQAKWGLNGLFWDLEQGPYKDDVSAWERDFAIFQSEYLDCEQDPTSTPGPTALPIPIDDLQKLRVLVETHIDLLRPVAEWDEALRQWRQMGGRVLEGHERYSANSLMRDVWDLMDRLRPPTVSLPDLPPGEITARDAIALCRRAKEWCLSQASGRRPGRLLEPEQDERPNSFVVDGDGFYIEWAGDGSHFGSLVGFGYILRLIQQQGVAIHVFELTGATISAGDEHSPQPVLDPEAKRQIQAQLDELAAEIDDAKACQDEGRQIQAEEENERLHAQLSRDLGLGQCARDMNNPVGKARTAVTNALGRAYNKLRLKGMESVADHLTRNIKCNHGMFIYMPESPVHWSTEPKKRHS